MKYLFHAFLILFLFIQCQDTNKTFKPVEFVEFEGFWQNSNCTLNINNDSL